MVEINKAEGQQEAGPAMNGVSALLRQARESKGLDISFISRDLRIRQEFLQAIEEERYGDLPGQAYALGFVRGYAEFLGLDSAEIVRRFKQESENFAKAPELVFRAPVNESNIPGFKILLAAVLLGGVGYGVWHGFQSGSSLSFDSGSFTDRLAQMINLSPNKNEGETTIASAGSSTTTPTDVERNDPTAEPDKGAAAPSMAAATSTNASSPSTPSAGQTAGAVPTQGGLNSSAATSGASGAIPAVGPATSFVPPSQVAQTNVSSGGVASAGASKPPTLVEERSTAIETMRSSESASPAMGQVGAAGLAPGRVLLRADQDCWIEIRDQHGSVVSSRLLRKGETHSVPDQRGLVLTAGNAGALAVIVDGKILPPLGRMGMVRRDLSLDPDSLTASLAAGE